MAKTEKGESQKQDSLESRGGAWSSTCRPCGMSEGWGGRENTHIQEGDRGSNVLRGQQSFK